MTKAAWAASKEVYSGSTPIRERIKRIEGKQSNLSLSQGDKGVGEDCLDSKFDTRKEKTGKK